MTFLSECWNPLREVERGGSRPGDSEGPQFWDVGLVDMGVVLQGSLPPSLHPHHQRSVFM